MMDEVRWDGKYEKLHPSITLENKV